MLSLIKNLRKELHQYPELSGKEIQTAQRLKTFIAKHNPTRIVDNLGGHGLAAIYEFAKKGPAVMIRCELDALPITENNDFIHQSVTPGIAHKCGHDGHMAIVAGLVFWIKKQRFSAGKIILLFQPAEETGQGAFNVLQDRSFEAMRPDYIFALHNIPGEQLHKIIWTPKGFSATVQSVIVHLKGKQCHASEPENGINPALGISEIIQAFSGLNEAKQSSDNFAILTPIHINMGQKSYGVSAGIGEIHYTLRTWSTDYMHQLKDKINTLLSGICKKHRLTFTTDWLEYFPAAVNNSLCNDLVKKAADHNNFELVERDFPFKFGEDFGWFAQKYPAAMFGVGAGIKSPALHHSDYDFPEELIPTGMRMFQSIISRILPNHKEESTIDG